VFPDSKAGALEIVESGPGNTARRRRHRSWTCLCATCWPIGHICFTRSMSPLACFT